MSGQAFHEYDIVWLESSGSDSSTTSDGESVVEEGDVVNNVPHVAVRQDIIAGRFVQVWMVLNEDSKHSNNGDSDEDDAAVDGGMWGFGIVLGISTGAPLFCVLFEPSASD